MSYKVAYSDVARRHFEKLPMRVRERIFEATSALKTNPRPVGCKKLSGRDGWRIRVGDYRIIYEVRDNELLVLIIELGHRRDIYRP